MKFMSLRIFAKKILTLSFWIPASKACILLLAAVLLFLGAGIHFLKSRFSR